MKTKWCAWMDGGKAHTMPVMEQDANSVIFKTFDTELQALEDLLVQVEAAHAVNLRNYTATSENINKVLEAIADVT